jgi:lipopolysaccharide/colanic/teichoic acid biosynthesis glycosyltransferase/GGDEF domain-containing protein
MADLESKIAVNMNAGFCNRHLFEMRLREERRRTDRSSLPFSLMIMDISDLADSSGKYLKLKNQKIKKVISSIVVENSRNTDIKSWHNDKTIKFLLPGTSLSGAKVLAKRFQTEFNNSTSSFFGLENLFHHKKNIIITSYPNLGHNSKYFSETQDPANKSKNQFPTYCTERINIQTISKMHWNHGNQIAMVWPLYSDLLIHNVEKRIKRMIDIIGAIIGMFFLSPVMLIIAIMIKITSPGPILFRQVRMGFLGKKFTFLKFRSMHYGCDERSHKEYVSDLIKNNHNNTNRSSGCKPVFKMENDPRITFFGKFIRKSSLDELPQLYNVLKGDMSIVGPRPPIPYEVENYECWHLRRVLEVRPGITGLWQVCGRSITTFDEMVRLDISYVNNWSLWLDIKIIFKTIWVVLTAKGAY